MRAAILSVGTELLFGQIINTNSVYLSRELQMMGFDVLYHYTVGDNAGRLKEILRAAFKDCELVVATGGLGPTQDDLTKEAVSDVQEDHLRLHEPSLEAMEKIFSRMNRPMPENNKKQAWLPSRAVIFENSEGTAPGFALENGGKTIICLPGPPREMKSVFENKARPFLQSKSGGVIAHKILRAFGVGESVFETELLDLIGGQTDPTLATYAGEGECSLRIASKRESEALAGAAVADMERRVMARAGRYIYSDNGDDLPTVVGKKLISGKISVSSAESCTGGLFAEKLTGVPGISAVFGMGFVTYSNRAKAEALSVSEEILEKYGAVSEETARAMARGVREATGSRLCVSVTGVAGPGGGTPEKPVGLVYIGCLLDGKETCLELRSRDVNRAWNRNYAVLAMFDHINKRLAR
ncbi:MAG: competence/damage-inducible protein A [Clostridiales Family XIII bacterium]|jgi:nicotinamide-nucleotide amidase|nr:competence/damage-inducible protein A [Clostridiales Family XIII bacterium]